MDVVGVEGMRRGGEGRVAVERMRAGVEGVGGEKSRRLHCHTPSPLSLSLSFFFDRGSLHC